MGCRELQVNDYFRMTDSASGTDVPYYALADANKNITEYFDTNGNAVAHYEYSPFGKITQSIGTMTSEFDYRFSSEVFDDETNLVYYNYRYYSAELGRWLSRDPLYERGSTVWLKFNREDNISLLIRKINNEIYSLNESDILASTQQNLQILTDILNIFKFLLLQEMAGIPSDCNPYIFVRNNSVNGWDSYGAFFMSWEGWTGFFLVAGGGALLLGTPFKVLGGILFTGGIILVIDDIRGSGDTIDDSYKAIKKQFEGGDKNDPTPTPGKGRKDRDNDGYSDVIDDYPDDSCKH